MAIVDSPAFSQSQVETELGLGPGPMAASFAAADDAKFDQLYKGNKDRQSNFRNYNGNLSIQISTQGISESGSACALPMGDFAYHNGVDTFPEQNDTIYTDSGLTNPFNGLGLYWRYQDKLGTYSIGIISNVGLLQGGISSCT